MNLFVCAVCGHVAFGSAPDNCPVCAAVKFDRNDQLFVESASKTGEGSIKHIPQVTVKKECGMIPEQSCVDVLVRVGEVLHPMEEKHLITNIDLYVDDAYVARKMLTPGVYPAAVFHVKATGAKVRAVESCNLHGAWTTEVDL
ncbi:MAG: hypothetical protein GF398_16160 [Chitinivibrionales bacterium]|nr:hypothetical protein [Chitinivibrionales bacterium]